MGQMTTVGQVEAHQTLVRAHDSLVNLQVRRGTGQALDVDTPLVTGDAESGESTLLAKDLDGVDVLIATVVTGSRVSLGVLVGHN